jgi:hypothetical protein
MGYNLYITRKKNYTDETGPDITAAECLAYVANDPRPAALLSCICVFYFVYLIFAPSIRSIHSLCSR